MGDQSQFTQGVCYHYLEMPLFDSQGKRQDYKKSLAENTLPVSHLAA